MLGLLGHGHRAIAERFAGRGRAQGKDRFAGARWVGGASEPLVLADALASFNCQVDEIIERFSHAIVIGRVTASRADGGNAALAYWCVDYARVGDAPV